MSQQSSTTTNTASEPTPCETGCGFFGSSATGNRCSKCWAEKQKDLSAENAETSTPMEVDAPESPQTVPLQAASSPVCPAVPQKAAVPVTETPVKVVKKKKKKKNSYKSMMANMTKRTKDENDIQREKESLRKVTGGGTFSKIDKI